MATIPLIFVIAGVLLVVVAVVGGGLEVKELKVPPLSPSAVSSRQLPAWSRSPLWG